MLSDTAARSSLSATRFESSGIFTAAAPDLSGRLGGGLAFERADRVARDLVESLAVFAGQVRDNFAAHPRIPETAEMVRGPDHRLGTIWIRGLEEIRDLIRHRDQVMDVHRDASSIGASLR